VSLRSILVHILVRLTGFLQLLVRLSSLCRHVRPRLMMRSSTGHSGKHGHEFLEFEYSHGRLRYANNSNYRNDSLIRKESACSASESLECCSCLFLLHLASLRPPPWHGPSFSLNLQCTLVPSSRRSYGALSSRAKS
jgi:hypothetical protein